MKTNNYHIEWIELVTARYLAERLLFSYVHRSIEKAFSQNDIQAINHDDY